MLSTIYCVKRQKRLLEYMQNAQIDSAVITTPRMVYYFSGALVDTNWPQAFVLRSDAEGTLITNREPAQCAGNRVRTYTAYTIERPFGRHTMQDELNRTVADLVGRQTRSVGMENDSAPVSLMSAVHAAAVDISPALTEMRRRKDPDELDCIRATIALTEAGYAAVKAALQPDMTEYEAYSIIQGAITAAAKTAVELKGDFACGARAIGGGGPPTNRRVQAGDLYIFDLFPIFEGYMCDLCRTFAVGRPTDEQHAAWAHVVEGHRIAGELIRPGNLTRDVYAELLAHLDRHDGTRGSFKHHAGHGVGMEGWEQPWLNAGGDQVFLEGEVVACEPGLYAESLQGGIRLEHNYLVTSGAPVALDIFPMDL